MLHFRTGLLGFVVAHLLSNVLLWNFYHILVSRFYAKVKLQVDLPLWKELFLTALPMGGGVMLRQLALNIDIFILGIMTKNMTNVGLFGGPYRLSWSLRMIPQTLALPLYPLYSRTAHFSPARFGEVYRQSLKFFTLISVPAATFFIAWSKPLLTLALGNRFLPALPAMQLLGLGLIPFFISTLFQYVFAALDAQKSFFLSTLVGSSLRVILLVTLIPRYNFVGPAVAFVCAETVTVGLWIYQVQKLGLPGTSGQHSLASARSRLSWPWCLFCLLIRQLSGSCLEQFSQFSATVQCFLLFVLSPGKRFIRPERALLLFRPLSSPG